MHRRFAVLAFVCAVLLLFGQAAAAQQAGEGKAKRGRAGGPLGGRIAQELNLTEDQKARLNTLFDQHREQMGALRQDTSLTQEQRREKMRELRESMHTQMTGILTPEQQEKFRELRQQRGKRAGARGHGPGRGRGPGPSRQPE